MAEIIALKGGGKSLEYGETDHGAIDEAIRSLDPAYGFELRPDSATLSVKGVKLIACQDPLGRCLISSDPAGASLIETLHESLLAGKTVSPGE